MGKDVVVHEELLWLHRASNGGALVSLQTTWKIAVVNADPCAATPRQAARIMSDVKQATLDDISFCILGKKKNERESHE
jgi:hypothetical protein